MKSISKLMAGVIVATGLMGPAVCAPAQGKHKAPAKTASAKPPLAGKPAAVPTAPAQPAMDILPVTGDAAWKMLVGNTVSGHSGGQELVESYLPDGTVKTVLGGENMTGRWALVEGRPCFQYPGDERSICYEVRVAAGTATFVSGDGEGVDLKIESGTR